VNHPSLLYDIIQFKQTLTLRIVFKASGKGLPSEVIEFAKCKLVDIGNNFSSFQEAD
jgi:hypothetical protein